MFKLKIDDELHLELIHFSHASKILEIVDRNRVLFTKWLLWVDSMKSVEDEEKFIKSSLERYANGKLMTCVVFYKNTLVGNVELSIKKGYGTKQGELGYWLDSKFHKKGIIQRASRKMLEIGFKQYDLDKIVLKCAVRNERSCNVAQKLGMSHEGRLKEEIKVDGVVMDVDIYGILKREFI